MAKKLAIQTEFMEQQPEVQICQTEEIWVRRGVRVNPKAKHAKPSGDIFRRSLDLCLVSPSAVMMTKQLFNQFRGFDESFPVCEDYDLWLRIGVDHTGPFDPDVSSCKARRPQGPVVALHLGYGSLSGPIIAEPFGQRA